MRPLPERRRQRRAVHRAQARQDEIEGRRIQPLDRQFEVAVERALDGVVQRQLDDGARRDRVGGTRLIGAGGGEIACRALRAISSSRARSVWVWASAGAAETTTAATPKRTDGNLHHHDLTVLSRNRSYRVIGTLERLTACARPGPCAVRLPGA